MTRRESLNVHNSNRMFNCNLTTKQEEGKFIKVTTMNQDRLNKEMDSLKKESTRYNIRDNNRYLLYKQRYGNDTLNDKIIDHGGFVHYYTEDKVTVDIINNILGSLNY